MAKRRSRRSSKGRRSRSHGRRRSNPRRSHSRRGGKSRRRRVSFLARNPGKRRGRRSHGRGRRRRNPGGLSLRSLMPSMGSVKDVVRVGGGVALGYVGVNGVMLVLNRFFLDKFKADKSAGVATAIDIAARAFVGVPVVTMLGGQVLKGQRTNIAAGALGNVALKGLKAVSTQVPGLPAWSQDLLGDYDGGVFDYLTAANQPGMHDYMTTAGRGTPGSLAPSLVGARRGSW